MTIIKNFIIKFALVAIVFTAFSCKKENAAVTDASNETASLQEHPSLILTAQGVKDIRAQLGSIPVFDNTLKAVQEEIDAEIALGIDTPIPVDYSGGYTHVRHKRNIAKSRSFISDFR